MKIHIISNSLKMNSGFSNVARHMIIGLRNLGHDVTFTGMQTPYLPEFTYEVEVLPVSTFYVDELTQYIINLQKIQPDVVIAIFQSDSGSGDLVQFPLIFKNTFWYTVVEGDNLPLSSYDGYKRVIANGGKIVLPSKHGQRQAKESGIDVYNISYGFDNNIYKPINLKNKYEITYCFSNTEFGKAIANPIKLCEQGCYKCGLNSRDQQKCQYFHEEEITLLIYDKSQEKWIEKRIKISDLPSETIGKFVFGHVKQNFGIRHRMERLLKAYSIFLNQSRQIKDRILLHIHTMPISVQSPVNLIKIAKDLDIENNIIFSYGNFRSSSWSDEAMNILYNTFDCNCSASSGEGLGLPTIESMACGIPQIGPKSSAFIELIEEDVRLNNKDIGPRGILAKIATWQLIDDGSNRSLVDEEDLAKCMKLIYYNENYKLYRKNCLEFTKNYTWNKVVYRWDRLLLKKC